MIRIRLILILVFAVFKVHAQNKVICITLDGAKTCSIYADSIQAEKTKQDWILQHRKLGYLSCSIDSSKWIGDSLIHFAYKGNELKELRIKSHTIPQEFLDSNTKIYDYSQWAKKSEQILSYYENQGFPFAFLEFRKASIVGNSIQCEIFFNKGIEIKYDSIEYAGNCSLSKKYLSQYLNIREGDVYRELSIKRIDKLLRNLPLVKVNGRTRIYFYQGLARAVLYIEDRTTDRFDGVVGLAPNSANSTSNKLLVTGELNLELNNLFRSARQMELHWKNYLQRSQMLETSLSWPYLFNSRIGINGAFNLNKYDTLFVNIKSKLGFRYQQLGNNYIQFYYEYQGSNLISVDTSAVRLSKTIPNNNPYRIDNYGLSLSQINYDYRPNPRSGYFLYADIAVGLKQLLRNTLVEQVQFFNTETQIYQSIYDTLNAKSTRAKLEIKGVYHIPVFKRSSIVNQFAFNGIFANSIIFNEFYNFGGFSTLQGFDENEFFASKMLMYRLEYRYLFSQNGNIGLFMNAAAYENRIEKDELIRDTPLGFGISANIEVGNGVLSLAYALGSRLNNPVAINAAKFHFGLINYF